MLHHSSKSSLCLQQSNCCCQKIFSSLFSLHFLFNTQRASSHDDYDKRNFFSYYYYVWYAFPAFQLWTLFLLHKHLYVLQTLRNSSFTSRLIYSKGRQHSRCYRTLHIHHQFKKWNPNELNKTRIFHLPWLSPVFAHSPRLWPKICKNCNLSLETH